MSNDELQDEAYDIGFVDPSEIVAFIQDEDTLEQHSEIATGSDNDDEVLRYTTQILEDTQNYVIKKQEDTRGKLAVLYTILTFVIFLITIGVAVLDGLVRHVSIIENISTILPLISGIFLGILGFVIGYYFKKEDV